MARGSAVKQDLRLSEPYEVYEHLKFQAPFAESGDCLGRYLIRIEEMRQSLSIIQQVINTLPPGSHRSDDFKAAIPPKFLIKTTMEALIHHFRLNVAGHRLFVGEHYAAVEAPKGEFGVVLCLMKTGHKFSRCKIKAPGFAHLQGLNFMVKNLLIADVVTVIGTQDIVFGEVDR